VPSLLHELTSLLPSFRVLHASGFEWAGQRYVVEEPTPLAGSAPLGAGAVERLGEVLYSALHCRLSVESWAASVAEDPAQSRAFIDRLSLANSGTGPWQGGWIIRSAEPDGTLIAERLGVRFRVPAGLLRSASPPTIGSSASVRVPKEYRHLLGGFFMALGDADDTMTDADTARVYWNVRASGAEALVESLTSGLNAAQVPFWLKLVDAPQKYQRTDAAVLYVKRELYREAEPVIARVHEALRDHMRDSVSAFALRLARGLAVAEDPGGGASFGQHRSRLLADALAGFASTQTATVTVSATGASTPSVASGARNSGLDAPSGFVAAVTSAFERAGIALRATHLSPLSTTIYAPFDGAPLVP
jgi:hypothetical protein